MKTATLGSQNLITKVLVTAFMTLGVLSVVGCGRPGRHNPTDPSTESGRSSSKKLICSEVQTNIWKSSRKIISQGELTPTPEQFAPAIARELEKTFEQTFDDKALDKIGSIVYDIYEIVKRDSKTNKIRSKQEIASILLALDVGDSSSPSRRAEIQRTKAKVIELYAMVSSIAPDCEGSTKSPEKTESENIAAHPQPSIDTAQDEDEDENQVESISEMKSVSGPASDKVLTLSTPTDRIEKGIQLTFATAYQSCDVLKMRPLNFQSPNATGISVTGYFNGSRRKIRRITDLQSLLQTHYYLKSIRVNSGNACVDIKRSPLIYNYGGKPAFHWDNEKIMTLFQQGGSGPSLGIDCSGFVFTAFATSGMRLKRGRPLMASDADAWQSSSYVRPQENGLTCLKPISLSSNSSIKIGDTIAINGHVVIIAAVGSDPLGIASAKSVQDCNSVSSRKFDFNIAQSSPSKGGVGINVTKAADFFASGPMTAGMEEYARKLCVAKFQSVATSYPLRGVTISRHLQTADCLDQRIKLDHEECVSSCFAKL